MEGKRKWSDNLPVHTEDDEEEEKRKEKRQRTQSGLPLSPFPQQYPESRPTLDITSFWTTFDYLNIYSLIDSELINNTEGYNIYRELLFKKKQIYLERVDPELRANIYWRYRIIKPSLISIDPNSILFTFQLAFLPFLTTVGTDGEIVPILASDTERRFENSLAALPYIKFTKSNQKSSLFGSTIHLTIFVLRENNGFRLLDINRNPQMTINEGGLTLKIFTDQYKLSLIETRSSGQRKFYIKSETASLYKIELNSNRRSVDLDLVFNEQETIGRKERYLALLYTNILGITEDDRQYELEFAPKRETPNISVVEFMAQGTGLATDTLSFGKYFTENHGISKFGITLPDDLNIKDMEFCNPIPIQDSQWIGIGTLRIGYHISGGERDRMTDLIFTRFIEFHNSLLSEIDNRGLGERFFPEYEARGTTNTKYFSIYELPFFYHITKTSTSGFAPDPYSANESYRLTISNPFLPLNIMDIGYIPHGSGDIPRGYICQKWHAMSITINQANPFQVLVTFTVGDYYSTMLSFGIGDMLKFCTHDISTTRFENLSFKIFEIGGRNSLINWSGIAKKIFDIKSGPLKKFVIFIGKDYKATLVHKKTLKPYNKKPISLEELHNLCFSQ